MEETPGKVYQNVRDTVFHSILMCIYIHLPMYLPYVHGLKHVQELSMEAGSKSWRVFNKDGAKLQETATIHFLTFRTTSQWVLSELTPLSDCFIFLGEDVTYVQFSVEKHLEREFAISGSQLGNRPRAVIFFKRCQSPYCSIGIGIDFCWRCEGAKALSQLPVNRTSTRQGVLSRKRFKVATMVL